MDRLRTRVEERIWSLLAASASDESKAKLEALLSVENRHSILERLRKGPFRRSVPAIVRALQRVQEVRRLGIDLQPSQCIPPTRLQALARFASTAKVTAIQRMPESRRLATLVAFAHNLEACALDDCLDLLDILITEVFSEAEKALQRPHALGEAGNLTQRFLYLMLRPRELFASQHFCHFGLNVVGYDQLERSAGG